jgi:transposase
MRQSLFATPFQPLSKMEIDQHLEQRINIKFLVKLGKSGPKICQMLQQAYGKDALKSSTVFKWVQRYQEGR